MYLMLQILAKTTSYMWAVFFLVFTFSSQEAHPSGCHPPLPAMQEITTCLLPGTTETQIPEKNPRSSCNGSICISAFSPLFLSEDAHQFIGIWG